MSEQAATKGDIEELKHLILGFQQSTNQKLDKLEGRIGNLEDRFDNLEIRVGNLEDRFSQFQTATEKRFDNLEGRFNTLENRVDQFQAESEKRFDQLDEKIELQNNTLSELFTLAKDADNRIREHTQALQRIENKQDLFKEQLKLHHERISVLEKNYLETM